MNAPFLIVGYSGHKFPQNSFGLQHHGPSAHYELELKRYLCNGIMGRWVSLSHTTKDRLLMRLSNTSRDYQREYQDYQRLKLKIAKIPETTIENTVSRLSVRIPENTIIAVYTRLQQRLKKIKDRFKYSRDENIDWVTSLNRSVQYFIED